VFDEPQKQERDVAHTPGPWKLVYNEEDPSHSILMGTAVAQTGRQESHHEWRCDHGIYEDEDSGAMQDQFSELESNGILMTAAPELLEMLATAIARIKLANAEGNPILSAWLPDAESLIRKIRG
jgi:hypothetical protein